MRAFILILPFFLLQFSSLNAQDSIKVYQNNSTAQESEMTQTEYYQRLLKQSEQQNSKLLSIFYWSLGTLITILIAIIVSSIWYNYRFSKKEVENIIKAAEDRVEDLKSEIRTSLDDDFSSFKDTTKNDIESELESFEKQLDAYKKSHDERFETLAESISNAREKNQIYLEKFNNFTDYRFKSLEQKVEKNEGRIWNLEGVKNNALSNFIRAGKKAIDLGQDPKFITDDIIEVLEEMDYISQNNSNSLNEFLDQLDDKFQEQKDKINAILDKLPTHDLNADIYSKKLSDIPGLMQALKRKKDEQEG